MVQFPDSDKQDNMASPGTDTEMRERLLKTVKKEVKQIMEEAVTRKFVHEESGSITSLCGAVEACLQHGLKKRALGLFKNSTTTALLHKVSKNFDPAAQIVKILSEIETNNEQTRKSIDNNRNQMPKKPSPTYNPKYLWIRLALFEKQLAKIIDYLVQNCSKYYEKEALICDPCDGPILASLLVGPCALDYTKMKTGDHYWTDPPADELVQRHRIHSSGTHLARPDSPKRPGLQVVRRHTSSSSEESMRAVPLSAKEYVESLHQNSRSTLLYGKNNVMVQPKEDIERLPGYLSLHQGADGLTIKWTPNQLMNGCCETNEKEVDRSLYWDYAVAIFMEEIVYLHCHQQPDSGGTIVLVGQDGVQRPPIHFPKGGHLLAFLSCLENGLLPHGQLDPPLWTQRAGKVFPKLKRKGSKMNGQKGQTSIDEGDEGDMDEEATDYVFRIVYLSKPDNIGEMLEPRLKEKSENFPWPQKKASAQSPLTQQPVSAIQSYAKTQQHFNNSCISKNAHSRSAVKQLCDTMRNQILSRAFYGWLAHCRHLKTVRTHLSGLVNTTVVPVDNPSDASDGITAEAWADMVNNGVVTNREEMYRLVYYGGCENDIRKEVWPYLLGHYEFGSTPDQRNELEESIQQHFEATMSEWLAVEAIVRQRDKEIMAANLAKLSQESQDGTIPLVRKDSSLSNDVFESIDSEEFSHPSTLPEESETAVTTPTPDQETPTPSLHEVQAKPTDHKLVTRCVSIKDSTSTTSPDEGLGDSLAQQASASSKERCDSSDTDKNVENLSQDREDRGIIITNPSVDSGSTELGAESGTGLTEERGELREKTPPRADLLSTSDDGAEHLCASRESLTASPCSQGGIYSAELLDNVALNLHRIDKDVQRCDRNYWYFTPANLEKLRNVMCTYVWEHLDVGYIQGMCDLVAPLLVIFDDEAKTYSCFCQLMKRMSANFPPHGGAMDTHFANMRSLIQILDPELFEHMHQNGDYTHFYFCYRWFLLDFKRELVYEDVFAVWETIWAAKHISSTHFVLFIALALVEYYREIILDNNMDFTDIIKFFNEMAERHNAKQVLKLARDLVYKLQDLIENK